MSRISRWTKSNEKANLPAILRVSLDEIQSVGEIGVPLG